MTYLATGIDMPGTTERKVSASTTVPTTTVSKDSRGYDIQDPTKRTDSGSIVVETTGVYASECRAAGIPDSLIDTCKYMRKVQKMSIADVAAALLKKAEESGTPPTTAPFPPPGSGGGGWKPPTKPALPAPRRAPPSDALPAELSLPEDKPNWLLIGGIAGAAVFALLLLRRPK